MQLLEFLKAQGGAALRSRFLKDGANIALGVILSQLIVFTTIPVLSRMYDQSVFGVQAPYNTILIIFAILASLGLNSAIPMPADKKEGDTIMKLQFILGFAISISVLVLITVFSYLVDIDLFERLFKTSFNFFLLVVIILGIFMTVYINSIEVRLIQLNKTFKVSIGKVLKASSMVIAAVAIYYSSIDNRMALIYASFSSLLLVALFYLPQYRLQIFTLTKKEIVEVFRNYRRFIQFTLPNSLLNSISFNVPNFLLIALYTENVAGNYAMAFKLVSLPTLFFTSSLRNVFLAKAATLVREAPEKLYDFAKKVLFGLHLVSFLVYFVVFLISDWIVPFYLGEDWIEAAYYIKILSIWQFLLIANSSMSGMLQVIDKQDSAFYYEILLFLARMISLIVPFVLDLSGETAVLLYSLVGFIFNAYLSYFYLNTGKKFSRQN